MNTDNPIAQPRAGNLRRQLDARRCELESKSGLGRVSVGLGSDSFRPSAVNSSRVFWIPAGLPVGRSIHIASSRLGRQPDSKPGWFDALRTICSRWQRGKQFLVSADGTASHKYVKRAAQLFQIPIVSFCPLRQNLTAKWFAKTYRNLAASDSKNKIVFYGEPLAPDIATDVDSLLISSACELRLLSVRKGGNVCRCTMDRLAEDQHAASMPWLLVDDRLTSEPVQETLIAAGACAWWLYDGERARSPDAGHSTVDPVIVSVNDIELDDYLLHWTRCNNGPWPGDTQSKYLDDLIFGAPAARHDRLSALCRIIASGKLSASRQLTRDPRPVVCFSAVTADQLPQLRTFRPHLGRWDFETIGIAIRKSLLKKQGARPVIYGDQSTWKSLQRSERPYFQVRHSTANKVLIDWMREKEWRVLGDVDLRGLQPHDAFVFVSSNSEAQTIGRLSRWPIVNLLAQ